VAGTARLRSSCMLNALGAPWVTSVVRCIMKVLSLVVLAVSVGLAGCELCNLLPRNTVSKTDVASGQKGPSAEMLITGFSLTLKDEADHKPCPPAWGTYERYWKSRMEYIARHESKDYYERVFRDFDRARVRIPVRKWSRR